MVLVVWMDGWMVRHGRIRSAAGDRIRQTSGQTNGLDSTTGTWSWWVWRPDGPGLDGSVSSKINIAWTANSLELDDDGASSAWQQLVWRPMMTMTMTTTDDGCLTGSSRMMGANGGSGSKSWPGPDPDPGKPDPSNRINQIQYRQSANG